MKKRVILVAILIALVVLLAGLRVYAAPPQRLVILMPVAEEMNKSGAIDTQFKSMAQIISKKMGMEVVSQKVLYKRGERPSAFVSKAMRDKKADVALLFSIDYTQYKMEGGKDLHPLFTLTMNNSTSMKACFFTRKGEYKTVADLRGKKWGSTEMIASRYLLYTAGINEPLAKYFGSVTQTQDTPISTAFAQLKTREIDVLGSYEMIVKMSGELAKKDTPFEPFYCREIEHSWLFVARNDLDPAVAGKFRNIMFNAHKDPDFSSFKFMFLMFNGKFAPVDDATLSRVSTVADLIIKNKWRNEELAFQKKFAGQKKTAPAK